MRNLYCHQASDAEALEKAVIRRIGNCDHEFTVRLAGQCQRSLAGIVSDAYAGGVEPLNSSKTSCRQDETAIGFHYHLDFAAGGKLNRSTFRHSVGIEPLKAMGRIFPQDYKLATVVNGDSSQERNCGARSGKEDFTI
jgi:hypothetical protein